MNDNLNTLLVTLYVVLTDKVLPDLGFTRDGRPDPNVALTDAELLCLARAQHLLHGDSSESRWVRYGRYARTIRGTHFPYPAAILVQRAHPGRPSTDQRRGHSAGRSGSPLICPV